MKENIEFNIRRGFADLLSKCMEIEKHFLHENPSTYKEVTLILLNDAKERFATAKNIIADAKEANLDLPKIANEEYQKAVDFMNTSLEALK